MLETRYLITHQRCACRIRDAAGLETPAEVACWFWGRNVLEHVVYEGECPYRFTVGDTDAIKAVLLLYKHDWVKHRLPLRIPLIALHRQGWCRRRNGGYQDTETLVCTIGDIVAQA